MWPFWLHNNTNIHLGQPKQESGNDEYNVIISLLRPRPNLGQILLKICHYHLSSCSSCILVLSQYLVILPLELSNIRLRENFMSTFWQHNNINIHLGLRQIKGHKIIALNIAVGLDEYLLTIQCNSVTCKMRQLLHQTSSLLSHSL